MLGLSDILYDIRLPPEYKSRLVGLLKTGTKQAHHYFCNLLLVTELAQIQGGWATNECKYLECHSLGITEVHYISSGHLQDTELALSDELFKNL